MTKPTVKADPALWSDESKRSYGESYIKEYEDIEYLCFRCKTPCVFTAEDQKISYEVKKNYIWQRRTLCQECFRQRLSNESALRQYAEDWKTNRPKLESERSSLENWLSILEDNWRYGGSHDSAHIQMLKRLLKASA